jgi:hypothetical protein
LIGLIVDKSAHKVPQCTAYPGVTGADVDRFRLGIRDAGNSHSCRRCWVSQRYCATRENTSNPCQWPNVLVPLARAVAGCEEGAQIVRKCGYKGELGGDWREYAGWLGRRYHQRVWGEYFSNVMVLTIKVALLCHIVLSRPIAAEAEESTLQQRQR